MGAFRKIKEKRLELTGLFTALDCTQGCLFQINTSVRLVFARVGESVDVDNTRSSPPTFLGIFPRNISESLLLDTIETEYLIPESIYARE